MTGQVQTQNNRGEWVPAIPLREPISHSDVPAIALSDLELLLRAEKVR